MGILKPEDIPYLSQIAQVKFMEWGKVLFNIVQRAHDKTDRQLKESPRVCDEDIRRDWRYKLGYVEALHDILELPNQAAIFKP